ncbi:MAG TPA: hypothetical protein VNO30_16075 [Kofleriaceae bacterium]|nr:hypothetical protein [Kofleriaceae bacterium]
MAIRDDLEEALLACWNVDDLAVYADHLLAEGDPRGELIALDLRPDLASAEWRARRQAVLRGWLGSELAARAADLVSHGFVHALDDGKGAAGALAGPLLDSPAGAFVRSFTTRGPATRVRASLQRLAARPRPHLTRLRIAVRSGAGREPAIGGATTDALVAAAPRLVELEVGGRRVLDAFSHPALRRLHMSNHDSIVAAPGATAAGGGFLRITCATDTGRYSRAVSREELGRALATVARATSYDALYAEHADVFGESLPALLARLESAGLVHLQAGAPVLSAVGRGVLGGGFAAPTVRRPLERPPAPVPILRGENNVWLETHRQIAFVGHIHTLSRLACLWLERLPLPAATRRVAWDYLGLLHDLRRGPRAHAEESVSANLDRTLEQLATLQDAGLDPRRAGEDSVWQPGWSDLRAGTFRDLLRAAAGTRMTFVVR